jgi:rhodanese-related sulfurtransferase
MYNKRKLISLMLVLMLLVTFMSACTPEAEDPVDEDPIVVEDPLDADEVILEEVTSFLQSVGSTSYLTSGREILDLLAINPNAAVLVDMRSPADYEAGHIEGAINIPYAETGNKLNVLPTDKPVYFVCYSGQTSAQATTIANLVGIEAYSFQGGMNFGWSTLGEDESTLETTTNPLPEARELDLSEREQIMWDAATSYFSATDNYIVSVADLSAFVEDNPDAISVLDIRRVDDYTEGHIEGAINIPYAEVGDNIGSLSANRPIYVVCYSGQTAGIAKAGLRVAGFNAMSLSRGMIGWNGAELPVVTE